MSKRHEETLRKEDIHGTLTHEKTSTSLAMENANYDHVEI